MHRHANIVQLMLLPSRYLLLH